MLVTLSGIVMLVRPPQSPNAEYPMLMTPVSIVTLVRPHELNASFPMFVMLPGIMTLPKWPQA